LILHSFSFFLFSFFFFWLSGPLFSFFYYYKAPLFFRGAKEGAKEGQNEGQKKKKQKETKEETKNEKNEHVFKINIGLGEYPASGVPFNFNLQKKARNKNKK
jgi:hypothetical protein